MDVWAYGLENLNKLIYIERQATSATDAERRDTSRRTARKRGNAQIARGTTPQEERNAS